MEKLQVNPKDLRSAKENLDAQNNVLQAQIEGLTQMEAALSKMWEGDANQAFHNAFTTDIGKFQTFRELITSYGNVLEQAATVYEQKEGTNVNIANERKG